MHLIPLDLLYLMLPAGVANMAPVIVRKLGLLKFLDKPIDFGMMFRGKPLLGSHKTWRGLVSGIIAGIIITGAQALLAPMPFDLVDYGSVWLVLGVLMGAGALVGDAFKSFLKRRIGVPSGSPWLPYDQIDFGVGALVFISPIIWLGWPYSVFAVALLAVCHILIVRIGFWLHLRNERW